MSELMQETVTTATDAATEGTPLVCRCGSGPHATHAGRCERGHGMPLNRLHYQHGAYSFRDRRDASLPPDLRMTVAEFKSQVITDRGGLDELSAIEAARIGHLAEVETTLRLLASDIARNGLLTKKGRTRTVFGRWLEALDRWERARVPRGRRAPRATGADAGGISRAGRTRGQRAMTMPMPSQKSRLLPAEHLTAVVLRADLADAEREFDRIDAIGDAAAAVRVRRVIGPRIAHLRRALAAAERNRTQGGDFVA